MLEGLGYELRRLSVRPAPMPVSPRVTEEPAPVEPAVREARVFNSGSAKERAFTENMATIALAFRNGLITEAKARELAARL